MADDTPHVPSREELEAEREDIILMLGEDLKDVTREQLERLGELNKLLDPDKRSQTERLRDSLLDKLAENGPGKAGR